MKTTIGFGGQLGQSAMILVALALLSSCFAQESYDDDDIKDEIGLSTAEVLNQRGYICIDHIVRTKDDYAINLVQCSNPLVNYSDPAVANKVPVLFIHGTLFNGTCFVTDTPVPTSPRDYSKYNASQMSVEQIAAMYKGSPNKESLVVMLLDYAHMVFIMNRRNTVASRKAYDQVHGTNIAGDFSVDGTLDAVKALLDPTRFLQPNNSLVQYIESLSQAVNSSYWNFSLDEMAKYDLPACIDKVLQISNRSTLAGVGWSSGGEIFEMGLSTQPILNQLLSKVLFWSPSLYLGKTIRDTIFYELTEPLTSNYIGPIPPSFFNQLFDYIAINLCSTEESQDTICQAVVDFVGGYGGDMQLLKPGFFNSFPDSVSGYELGQLGRASMDGKTHMFKYTNPATNQAKYGSQNPPLYDVAKITLRNLFFWGASNDGLVSIDDVARNVADLKNATFIRLDQDGIDFEHFSYIFHKFKSELLYFQSLMILES